MSKLKAIFWTPKFFQFVLCGGGGTLVNFCVSLLASRYMNATLAYVIGYSVSLFVTYGLNTWLVFKQRFSMIRFVKFVISYIPNFLILFTFVAVLLNRFHLPEVVVYLAAAALGLPVTFVIVKLFAFGTKKEREEE